MNILFEIELGLVEKGLAFEDLQSLLTILTDYIFRLFEQFQ